MIYILIAILIIGVIVALIKSLPKIVFFKVLNLGFLPSGLDIANNIAPTGIYTLPSILAVIELIVHYILTLYINIVDFLCWLPAKIPILGFFLKFIESCPDKDLTTHGVDPLIGFLGLTGHRNFITHSILNPYIVIVVIIGLIISLIVSMVNENAGSIVRECLGLILFIYAAHLFADCMPKKWAGGSLIKVHILGISIVTMNGFFSKLWLMINGCVCIFVGGRIFEKSDSKESK